MVQLRELLTIRSTFSSFGFNSNMVQLREEIHDDLVIALACFNSNMVQLRAGALRGYSMALAFQFQYGAIKRVAGCLDSINL